MGRDIQLSSAQLGHNPNSAREGNGRLGGEKHNGKREGPHVRVDGIRGGP